MLLQFHGCTDPKVAGLCFPDEEGTNPREGAHDLLFGKIFYRKFHGNKRNWTKRGMKYFDQIKCWLSRIVFELHHTLVNFFVNDLRL